MAYEIYTLGVKRDWPCRLLHIPSMTSQEWRPGNLYGSDKEPHYAILSYTWGRFEVPDGPRLNVKGIDWQIPSIDPAHFTVAALGRLLEQIGSEYDYLWIDIACIDQKRDKEKMKEVGRQAAIFKGAKKGISLDHSDELDAAAMSFEWPPNSCLLDERSELIIESRIPELREATERQRYIMESLISKFGETALRVLYLGRAAHVEQMEVALILVRKVAHKGFMWPKKTLWRRVGICFWHVEGGHIDDIATSMKPLKGRFG